jgi:hypothetical protein
VGVSELWVRWKLKFPARLPLAEREMPGYCSHVAIKDPVGNILPDVNEIPGLDPDFFRKNISLLEPEALVYPSNGNPFSFPCSPLSRKWKKSTSEKKKIEQNDHIN